MSLSDIIKEKSKIMKVFKNTAFHDCPKKLDISDKVLSEAIKEINLGRYDANLGGNVYKKRIPLGNKGKSSGARTILAFKTDEKAFFIYGFAKNKKEDVDEKELQGLKKLARIYLNLTDEELARATLRGELIKLEV
jgi:hypothetical protein